MTVELSAMKDQIVELKAIVNGEVKRIANEQFSRGPRIRKNEEDIRQIYELIQYYHQREGRDRKHKGN